MLNQEKVDELLREFSKLLPADFRAYKQDLEKNLKAALNATFARMNLVTREEFDVQTALLSRTRELLEDLERKVVELEAKLASSSVKKK
jgi:hypothetical protein